MRITVKFFAILKDAASVSSLSIELPEGNTVWQAMEAVLLSEPRLRKFIPHCAFAVNRAYTSVETVLHDADELALIPPVSGG